MKKFFSRSLAIVIVISTVFGISLFAKNNNFLSIPVFIHAATIENQDTHLKNKNVSIADGSTYHQKLLDKNNEIISDELIEWNTVDEKIATINKNGKIKAI